MSSMWGADDLVALLVCEKGYSQEDAEALVKKYPDVVINGIMAGPIALRATAMALEMMKENEEDRNG